MKSILLYSFIFFVLPQTFCQKNEPLSITLDNYEYPYPVSFIKLKIEGQPLKMAYMDVKARAKENGKTVVLFHGKNFPGSYWKNSIDFLTNQGYRVIAPDQLGFGKSSKPYIHYSFHLLALNTRKLLDSLGIEKVALVGHSMGGMVATRYASMYYNTVTHLVLENPLGLEDYRLFVPFTTVEESFIIELNKTPEEILQQHKSYYVTWQPAFEEYPNIQSAWLENEEYASVALSSALTYHMIYQQPIWYEFPFIQNKTLLIIGAEDRTVIGKSNIPEEFLDIVGQFTELGKRATSLMPDCRLVQMRETGHIPHLEKPDAFNQEVLNFLNDIDELSDIKGSE